MRDSSDLLCSAKPKKCKAVQNCSDSFQVVDANIALDMFSENRFKVKQIPNIAEKSKTGRFTSRSPYVLAASLGQLGR